MSTPVPTRSTSPISAPSPAVRPAAVPGATWPVAVSAQAGPSSSIPAWSPSARSALRTMPQPAEPVERHRARPVVAAAVDWAAQVAADRRPVLRAAAVASVAAAVVAAATAIRPPIMPIPIHRSLRGPEGPARTAAAGPVASTAREPAVSPAVAAARPIPSPAIRRPTRMPPTTRRIIIQHITAILIVRPDIHTGLVIVLDTTLTTRHIKFTPVTRLLDTIGTRTGRL